MLEIPVVDRRPRWIELTAAATFAVLGIGYLVWLVFVVRRPEVDFRVFWFAGQMWNQGLDPYTSAFVEIGNAVLPSGNRLYPWLYPPNWVLICRALALFDMPTALVIWRALEAVLLLAVTGLLVAIMTRHAALERRVVLGALACALVAIVEPTPILLAIGQVSPAFVYAGLALIACGCLGRHDALLAAGLVLVALKPQVGLPALVAFALVPAYRKPFVIAVAVSAALTLPQIVPFGPLTTLREWTSNLTAFENIASNTQLTLTGPAHILGRLGIAFAPFAQLAIGIAMAIGSGLLMRREPHGPGGLCLLVAAIAALVPLHNYDMTILILAGALVLNAAPTRLNLGLVALAALLALRPSRLEALLGLPVYADSSGGVLTLSIAALLLFGLALAIAWKEWRLSAPSAAEA